MILVVCLNPTIQKTLALPFLHEGEVNRTRTYSIDIAGKGINVARILEQLGVSAIQLTHGGGLFLSFFMGQAEKDGVKVIAPDSGSEIRFCVSILDEEKGTTTEIVEESTPVLPTTEDAVRRAYHDLLPQCETLVICGTRAPGYSPLLYADFVREAKKLGKNVVLDIRGRDLRSCLAFGPDIVKTNLAEFLETFLEIEGTGENVREAALIDKVGREFERLWVDFGILAVTTNGKEDTLYFNGEGLCRLPTAEIAWGDLPSPTEDARVKNTIGCGDAVTAGFIHAWREDNYPPTASKNFRSSIEKYLRFSHGVAYLNALQIRPGRIR